MKVRSLAEVKNHNSTITEFLARHTTAQNKDYVFQPPLHGVPPRDEALANEAMAQPLVHVLKGACPPLPVLLWTTDSAWGVIWESAFPASSWGCCWSGNHTWRTTRLTCFTHSFCVSVNTPLTYGRRSLASPPGPLQFRAQRPLLPLR